MMTASSIGSTPAGPSPAMLLARGVCRALDQLGYAGLTVNRVINALGPFFQLTLTTSLTEVRQPDGDTIAV